jgi:membrane protease YdiL (CAAX protease family)
MVAQTLLAIVAVYVLAILWRGRTFRVRLPTRSGSGPARRMTAWAVGLAVSFGLSALIGLVLLGQNPLAAAQPAAIALLPDDWPRLPIAPLILGMALGTLANAAITHALWRPDVLPKTREDILPAIALAISAGISEELFFRLFLPLLIALVSGSALAGTIIAALCFGGVHRYQGWRGVVATTLSGVALSVLYGLTNSVWMAIAFHIAIDINALVVRPMARGAWRA